jgi:hypothetical protein
MRRVYSEPEIQIRNYVTPYGNIITTSDPNDLGGDDYPYDGEGSGGSGAGQENLFD